MNREQKLQIVRALIEDQAKSVTESLDLEDMDEVEAFLDKCLAELEMMIMND